MYSEMRKRVAQTMSALNNNLLRASKKNLQKVLVLQGARLLFPNYSVLAGKSFSDKPYFKSTFSLLQIASRPVYIEKNISLKRITNLALTSQGLDCNYFFVERSALVRFHQLNQFHFCQKTKKTQVESVFPYISGSSLIGAGDVVQCLAFVKNACRQIL